MRLMAELYRKGFADRHFRRAVCASLLILAAGVAFNFFAGLYATVKASNHVDDIVLSNIPVVNVEYLFVLGTFVLIGFTAALAIVRPHWVPFTAASLGVFYAIRGVFISLTHLGPFPDRIGIADWGTIVAKFIGGNDLFFSGHTGAPFLLALVFWRTPMLRYFFLAWSAFFGVTVLLGHLHYTIDVLSAYFITYAIFHICEYAFPKYREYFLGRT